MDLGTLMTKLNVFSPVKAYGPIGLKLSIEKLSLIQFRLNQNNQIELQDWASCRYPIPREQLLDDPKTFKSFIQQILKQHEFKGRRIVSVPPPNTVKLVSTILKVGSDETIESAILKQLTKRLNRDISNYVVDYLLIDSSSDSERKLALVVYAEQDKIIRYLDLMNSSGFKTDVLEIGPSSLQRLLSVLPKTNNKNILTINFGSNYSFLSVFHQGELVYDTESDFGENVLIEHIIQHLSLETKQIRELLIDVGFNQESQQTDLSTSLRQITKPLFLRFKQELKRFINYYQTYSHGASIDNIYIIGTVARWNDIESFLSEVLELEIKHLPYYEDLFDEESIGEVVAQKAISELAIPSGLALKDLVST